MNASHIHCAGADRKINHPRSPALMHFDDDPTHLRSWDNFNQSATCCLESEPRISTNGWDCHSTSATFLPEAFLSRV